MPEFAGSSPPSRLGTPRRMSTPLATAPPPRPGAHAARCRGAQARPSGAPRWSGASPATSRSSAIWQFTSTYLVAGLHPAAARGDRRGDGRDHTLRRAAHALRRDAASTSRSASRSRSCSAPVDRASLMGRSRWWEAFLGDWVMVTLTTPGLVFALVCAMIFGLGSLGPIVGGRRHGVLVRRRQRGRGRQGGAQGPRRHGRAFGVPTHAVAAPRATAVPGAVLLHGRPLRVLGRLEDRHADRGHRRHRGDRLHDAPRIPVVLHGRVPRVGAALLRLRTVRSNAACSSARCTAFYAGGRRWPRERRHSRRRPDRAAPARAGRWSAWSTAPRALARIALVGRLPRDVAARRSRCCRRCCVPTPARGGRVHVGRDSAATRSRRRPSTRPSRRASSGSVWAW